MRVSGLSLMILVVTGCSSGDECADLLCGPCPPAIEIEVSAPGTTEPPNIAGPVALECHPRSNGWMCVAPSAPVGTHVFEVGLGAETGTVTVDVEEGGGGCCACSTMGGTGRVELGGRPTDGGIAVDASSGGCNPSLVEFPMEDGALEPGTLCDDVFACVPASAVDSVEAATVFDCHAEDIGLSCATGEVGCRYADPGGPSDLDEAEVANVCALSVHEPAPSRMVCRVYL